MYQKERNLYLLANLHDLLAMNKCLGGRNLTVLEHTDNGLPREFVRLKRNQKELCFMFLDLPRK